ncbi:MAG: hypothetical protein LWY06_00395 [Firmicutes bacterium]|nr:hypothetical protein [Bacillota bacterium]
MKQLQKFSFLTILLVSILAYLLLSKTSICCMWAYNSCEGTYPSLTLAWLWILKSTGILKDRIDFPGWFWIAAVCPFAVLIVIKGKKLSENHFATINIALGAAILVTAIVIFGPLAQFFCSHLN